MRLKQQQYGKKGCGYPESSCGSSNGMSKTYNAQYEILSLFLVLFPPPCSPFTFLQINILIKWPFFRITQKREFRNLY